MIEAWLERAITSLILNVMNQVTVLGMVYVLTLFIILRTVELPNL